jgi:hypothetical protein
MKATTLIVSGLLAVASTNSVLAIRVSSFDWIKTFPFQKVASNTVSVGGHDTEGPCLINNPADQVRFKAGLKMSKNTKYMINKIMTRDACVAFCQGVLAAVTNGDTCYCFSGSEFSDIGYERGSCTSPCSGNPSQKCGGPSSSRVISNKSSTRSEGLAPPPLVAPAPQTAPV